MSFLAQYRGTCATCEGQILPNQLITRAFNERRYAHATCPDPLPEIKRPVCDKCFTEKAANGACGCD